MRLAVIHDQRGFSLIELLVVVVIIALLAALAIPWFLDQRVKGQDASAKSNARNMVSEVEACNAGTNDYGDCTTASGSQLEQDIPDTTVTSTGHNHFLITATSHSGNTFSIERSGDATTRSCTVAGGTSGGCSPSLDW